MPIDFTKAGADQTINSLVSPRDIYTALPTKATGYGYLRDVQGKVLEAWESRRSERDLSIKMNTGTGKTIVGLLILRSCINEDAGPGLYVTPDSYLAAQVRAQANRVGIATVDNPESPRYLSGESIAVVNIQKLVNGRSIFGGPASTRITPIPIGSVVIDDAHAALATVEEHTTLTITRADNAEVFDQLLAFFRDDLQQQSRRKTYAIEQQDPTALLRVPFWSWANHADTVAAIFNAHDEEEGIVFNWPFVSEVLSFSQAVFTGKSLEIRPPCPPIDTVRSLAGAKRRIYLTATLADDSVLVTHFDAKPTSVENPITPPTAADIGDRLILAPQEINPNISDAELMNAVRALANRVNVVVLVPSNWRADRWRGLANETAAADDIARVVERLVTEKHVGLVVLISKYDGIDLPNDACRVLVIDGLPEAHSASDRRDADALGNSEGIIGRQLQRVEQGMGRGVRSAEDHCAVLLMGARLSQVIARADHLALLGPATRAQLQLSRSLATQLEDHDLDDILAVVQQTIDRDEGWVKVSRAALARVSYGGGVVRPSAIHSRQAFNAASIGQFAAACTEMSDAIIDESDDRLAGWLQEQQAVYKNKVDPAQAQQIMIGALRRNPRLTRPLEGVSYERISAAADQAAESARYLGEHYATRNELILGAEAILDDLVFDPARTGKFEDAVEDLGHHLGFGSQRPERDIGNGPDNLWAIGELRYLIIECKSGTAVTTAKIRRRDLGQLSNSVNWFRDSYDMTSTGIPVIVHRGYEAESNATPPPGTQVLTESKLVTLRDAFRQMVVALADGNSWTDSTQVARQLEHHHLTSGKIVARYTMPVR